MCANFSLVVSHTARLVEGMPIRSWAGWLLCLLLSCTLQAQTLHHEKVFNTKTLAKKGIRSASLTTINEFRIPVVEIYMFDEAGRFTGYATQTSNLSDTLYRQLFKNGLVHEIHDNTPGRILKTMLDYDPNGRLMLKTNMLNDTVCSRIRYTYNQTGQLIYAYECSTSGDTLSEAFYSYHHNRLTEISYNKVGISSIRYVEKKRKLITRVFNREEELQMTRYEKYRRDGLLKLESVSVTGIRVAPLTRYHYRSGLLRKVILPDGTKLNLKYKAKENLF